ncbi:MAG: SLBB domain-containing protein, partial [Bacteroidota bacterium]|nr:SLBB domain-containing protein [Bacteroidota bacterium]
QASNQSSSSSTAINQQQTIKSVIQDGPVDPKEYIVGPGDVFGINVSAAAPINLQIPVTPEGTIVIPTVASLYVSDMKLDNVKTIIINEIKRKYLASQIYVTLLNPRTFLVTVKGAVSGERTFSVQATYRVDAAVNYHPPVAPPMTQQQNSSMQQISYPPSGVVIDSVTAQRKIIIQHKNGTIGHADIEKFFATGNTLYNPLLQDGDVVTVPNKNITKDFFSVYGAVNREGEYEYVEGDSLSTALKISRGLTAIADSDKVVISRMSTLGKFSYININLKEILSGKQSDILLQRGDRIVVYENYNQHRTSKIFVEGEVRFPGQYPITEDSTYLGEIIQLAGGITKDAFLPTSQLFRRTVLQSDLYIERTANTRATIAPEEDAYYQFEANVHLNRELVVTDFTDLIEKHDTTKDILLRDGDLIRITKKKNTVYVFGQVLNPGHVFFVPNKNYRYYIEQAGGLTEYAIKGDIKIIKAKSRQWLDPSDTNIEEGDYVWVPKETYRPFAYYTTLYSQILGIVGTVATLYLLIRTIK